MADPIQLEPRYANGEFAIAVHGGLVVVTWGAETGPGNLAAFRETLAQVIETGKAVASLNLVRGVNTAMNAEDREASRALLRDFVGSYLGAALVVEGGGARMVLTRSVVTTVLLAARVPIQHKVLDSLPSALDWLAALPGFELEGERDELAAAVEAFDQAQRSS